MFSRRSHRHSARDAPGSSDRAIELERSITIRRPPAELYAFWRDLGNLATIMPGEVTIRPRSDRVSHWIAHLPGGKHIEWDAEITRDEPGRAIAWRSCDAADVENAGEVRFAPAADGTGTRVEFRVRYTPPGGTLGAMVGKIARQPAARKLDAALRALKEKLEAAGAP